MRPRLDDNDPGKWVYHTQTEKKHKILKSYLDAWFPILGSWNSRLVVVDGFAGRASYSPRAGMDIQESDDEIEGSPLIMLKSLINHEWFTQGRLKQEIIFLFIEVNDENYQFLHDRIEQFKKRHNPWPPNVKTYISHSKFEDVRDNGIEKYILNAQFDRLNQATFLFVDPFGFTGFSMELLANICKVRPGHKVELFLNFMSDFILRNATSPAQESNMAKLFGLSIEQWRLFRDETAKGDPSAQDLLDLFTTQWRSHAEFKHILSLEMKRENDTTIYYLIYATQHSKGLECMKESMWKVDPIATRNMLPNSDLLETLLLDYFKRKSPGAEFPIEQVIEYVLTETVFPRSHTKRALQNMERRECIDVKEGRSRKLTYPDGCLIVLKKRKSRITDFLQQRKPVVHGRKGK